MTDVFAFDEANHIYTLNGEIIPSVTEIIKPLTVDVAVNAKPWLRDAAADRGTRVHAYCADIDYQGNADGMTFDPDCVSYVAAYLQFLRDYRITDWLAVEYAGYNRDIPLAGTIDRIGVIDDWETIIDIKTGSKIDKAVLTAQLNGYLDIWQPTTYQRPRFALWGLQLRRDGTYKIIKCEHSDIFNHLMAVYKERKRILCKKKTP